MNQDNPTEGNSTREDIPLKLIIESVLFVADDPMTPAALRKTFSRGELPDIKDVNKALKELQADYEEHAIELKQVGTGFRFQVRESFSPWVGKLFEEKPPRYTRALLETLALIAYRQPITRGEIEDVRGVVVSTNIIKTMEEREWIKVVGHREVPGKPALFGTTKQFLDYFNLKSLDELPTLAEIQDLDSAGELLEENLADKIEDIAINEQLDDAKVETEVETETEMEIEVEIEAEVETAAELELDAEIAEAEAEEII